MMKKTSNVVRGCEKECLRKEGRLGEDKDKKGKQAASMKT